MPTLPVAPVTRIRLPLIQVSDARNNRLRSSLSRSPDGAGRDQGVVHNEDCKLLTVREPLVSALAPDYLRPSVSNLTITESLRRHACSVGRHHAARARPCKPGDGGVDSRIYSLTSKSSSSSLIAVL